MKSVQVFVLVGLATCAFASKISARKGAILEEEVVNIPAPREKSDKQTRHGRSSLVYTIAKPEPEYQVAYDPASLTMAALGHVRASPQYQQPKVPVLHATPLQPYGALLTPEKTIVATPRPIEHNGLADTDSKNHYDYTREQENDIHEHVNYAAKYQYGYHIRDDKSGSYFGQEEKRDGHVTRGQYYVLLPDGRLQNVQYWADPSGYHAEVSYKGIAHH